MSVQLIISPRKLLGTIRIKSQTVVAFYLSDTCQLLLVRRWKLYTMEKIVMIAKRNRINQT